MHWSMYPLAVFGLLNLFLAWTAPQRVKGAAGAAIVFGLAAVLIGWGLWHARPWLVGLGLIFSLDAPMRMGQLMHGRINGRHVAARLVIVTLFFLLWMTFRPV